MTRYLELTGIARALKAETWGRGSDQAEHGEGARGGGDTNFSGRRHGASGFVLATSSTSPP